MVDEIQQRCAESSTAAAVVARLALALRGSTSRRWLSAQCCRREICSLLTTRHGLGLTRQAISQHLGVLESAGLVITERRGRSKFHYFNPAPLSNITRRWPVTERTDS